MLPVLTSYFKDRFPVFVSFFFLGIILILYELVAEELQVCEILRFHGAFGEEPGLLGCDTVLLVSIS
jgi:hypothetical protein